jgi:small subunit ribosomal protein S8
MSITYPIADLLTRIRNALAARHDAVQIPHSRLKSELVKILHQEGYVSGYTTDGEPPFQTLTVRLKYGPDHTPVIRVLRCVSTPGRRRYVGRNEIPLVLEGLGINILSTSQGIVTGKKARELGIGGELLCEMY